MRIAVVTRTLARIGGVEAYVEQSVHGLREAGHDVCVFAEDRETRAAGLSVPSWAPHEAMPAVDAAVRTFSPQIVMSHGVGDPALEEALSSIGPSVFFAHAHHGTCISGAKAHSFPGIQTCQRTLGAGCLLRYFPRRCGGLNPVTMVREYGSQQRHLAAVRRHERVFALSAYIAGEYERHGVLRERIRVLPPPVPARRDTHDAVADPAHVVYLGRLTVAGEGSALADVQRAVARVPPRALLEVRLVGHLDSDACDALLDSAGLLVVPSLWPEPFGLVGFEAGAHGVPVAGFRVGGVPEWLTDGVTGHLANPFPDPAAALGEAIVQALSDDAHYADLRRGARAAHAAAAARDHNGALARALDEVGGGGARA